MKTNLFIFISLFFHCCLLAQDYYGTEYILKTDTLRKNDEFLYFDISKKTFAYKSRSKKNIIKLEVIAYKNDTYIIKFPNEKEIHTIQSHSNGTILSWLSADNSIRFFIWNEPICRPNFRDHFYIYAHENKNIEIIDLLGEFLDFPEKVYYYSAQYPNGVLLNIIKRNNETEEKKYVKVSFPNQKNMIYHLELQNIDNDYKLICVNPDKTIQIFSLFKR